LTISEALALTEMMMKLYPPRYKSLAWWHHSSPPSDGPRPTEEQVRELRGYMLAYVKQIVLKGMGVHEDELQAMLNFLTTVHEVSYQHWPSGTLTWPQHSHFSNLAGHQIVAHCYLEFESFMLSTLKLICTLCILANISHAQD
jgi:hypothetical protein